MKYLNLNQQVAKQADSQVNNTNRELNPAAIYHYKLVELVDESCISIEDGQKVYDLIHPHLLAGSVVELDFSGVENCTTSFLSFAIGQLLKDISLEKLTKSLKIINEDKPQKTQNLVLEFINKFGNKLTKDSDCWIIFAAMGYLQTIVLDSSQEWRETFFDSLNLIKASEISSRQDSQTLAHSLKMLENELTTTLNNSTQRVESRLNLINGNFSNHSTNLGRINKWTIGILLVGVMSILGIQWYDYQLLLHNTQRVQWILEKQNRRDCLDQIKPKDSPECQGL